MLSEQNILLQVQQLSTTARHFPNTSSRSEDLNSQLDRNEEVGGGEVRFESDSDRSQADQRNCKLEYAQWTRIYHRESAPNQFARFVVSQGRGVGPLSNRPADQKTLSPPPRVSST